MPPASTDRATTPTAPFPLTLPPGTSDERARELAERARALGAAAQYGWGHTVDLGPETVTGLLGRKYLQIAGALDAWDWWPQDLSGKAVADVGCYTGGLAMLMAGRGAAEVTAVDEVPENLEQCRLLVEAFGTDQVTTVESSLYDLPRSVPEQSFDVVLLAGVLYHLSDMLVGTALLARMLKPGGVLLVETNAVECYDHSYANFGRYFEGMWWQPTARCVADMAEHAGLVDVDVRFYRPGRALARAVRPAELRLPFRRGLNMDVPDRHDDETRTRDSSLMAPAPDWHAEAGLVRRVAARAGERGYRRSLDAGYRAVRAARRRSGSRPAD